MEPNKKPTVKLPEALAPLAELRAWCGWAFDETGGGKPRKVPRHPDGRPFSTLNDKPYTLDELHAGGFDLTQPELGGVGLVLTGRLEIDGATLVAFDLDACRDPVTGAVTEWATELMHEHKSSYTEVTPSGQGLRVLVLVHEPPGTEFRKLGPVTPAENTTKRAEIETFGLGRACYVTLTGRQVSTGKLETVRNLDWVVNRYPRPEPEPVRPFPVNHTGKPPGTLTAHLAKNERAARLLKGDWQSLGYPSSSEGAFELLQHALRAADGDGWRVLDWWESTAWATGDVECNDPSKYSDLDRMKPQIANAWASVQERDDAQHRLREAFTELPTPVAPDSRLVTSGPAGVSLADIFRRWSTEGPIDHYPTGIEWLDERTGGGPVPGTRWFLNGAPDAGKTLLGVQIAHTMAVAGVEVGVLTIDEESDDSGTRFAQRIGLDRVDVERRDPGELAELIARFESLPLTVYERGTTIEAAADDLRHRGGDRPAFLFIDSLQTAPSAAENGASTKRERVEARVAAIRSAAISQRLMVLTSSEVPRDYYKNRKRAEELDPLASGKESGDIDFAGRVILMLDVPDETRPELVRLRIGKNKQRPADASRTRETMLRIDLDRQTIEHAAGVATPEPGAGRSRGRDLALRVATLRLIRATPGISRTKLIDAARAELEAVSDARVRAAVAWLEKRDAVRLEDGPGRSTLHHPTDTTPDELKEVLGDGSGGSGE